MAIFSRRHYDWLAHGLFCQIEDARTTQHRRLLIETANRLANELSTDNSAFNKDRFLKAAIPPLSEN